MSGHPTIEVPGIEVNTGALGHGLSVGVGMAIAAKMDKADYKTYVLMGDGEQGEGSIYEAAMAGNQYKLDNLCPFWHKVTRAFVSMCLSQCYFLRIEKNMNDCMDFYFLTKPPGWLLLHSPDKCLSVHS